MLKAEQQLAATTAVAGLMAGAGPGPILRTDDDQAPVRMNQTTENSGQIHDIAVLDSTPISADRMTIAASGVDQALESFFGPIAQALSAPVFFELTIGVELFALSTMLFLMAFPKPLGLYFLSRILRLEILRLRKRDKLREVRDSLRARPWHGRSSHPRSRCIEPSPTCSFDGMMSSPKLI